MRTFAHADIRAPHSGPVTQVEFSDAGTLVSASEDGTTRFWDVATGTQKEEMPGEHLTFWDVATGAQKEEVPGEHLTFWDVATGAQKEEVPGEHFTFSQDASDKQTAGKYLVTKKGDLVLVYLTDTAGASEDEKAEQNKKPVAFFRAPAKIQTLHCAGDKIAVGCENGEVLLLRAAFLVA